MFHTPTQTRKSSGPHSMQDNMRPNSTKTVPKHERLMEILTSKPDEPLFVFDLNTSNGGRPHDLTQQTPAYARKDFIYCTPPLKNINSHFRKCVDRDLSSPSAAARVRALHAMKNPGNSKYYNFDISEGEHDIITHEERQPRPKTIQEVMKNVVIYVEIRNADDNRTAGVKNIISDLGARVNDKLLRNTTHVIFKDGLQSTYNKAKNWNIPIVSLSWIEACKKHLVLVEPAEYVIADVDRYENPELYEKIKRYKYKQPGWEENTKSAKSRRSSFVRQKSEETDHSLNAAAISTNNITNNENISMDESTRISSSNILDITPISVTRRSNRRHTIFGSQAIDETRVMERTPVSRAMNSNKCYVNADESFSIPRTPAAITDANKTLLEEYETTFSAKKTTKPNARRTIFDISMDIIKQRVENVNQMNKLSGINDKQHNSFPNDPLIGAPNSNVANSNSHTPLSTKRKLFTPSSSVPLSVDKLSQISSKRSREADCQPPSSKKIKTSSAIATTSNARTDDVATNTKTDRILRRSSRRSTLNFRLMSNKKIVESPKDKRCSESVIVFTNMHQQQIDAIKKAVNQLGKFKIEGKVTSKTSHLITLEPRRTMNLMRALIRGVWILKYDWIVASIENNQWQNEELFEMEAVSKAVKICRMERQLFGNTYRMNIFSDVGTIYLSNNRKCEDLKELIQLCDGELSNNYMDSTYIVGEYFPECGLKKCLSPNWIIDSIINAQITLPDLYCVNVNANK